MTIDREGLAAEADFRPLTAFCVAVSALALITPIALLNLRGEHPWLGAGSLTIVGLLTLCAWHQRYRGGRGVVRLWVVVPAILTFLPLSILVQGVIGLLWCYPAVLALYCILPERHARVTNLLLLLVVLPTLFATIAPEPALRALATLLAVSVFTATLVRVISRQQERLRAQLVTDPLTGLTNRQPLDERIAAAIARAERDGRPATLLALDLDHFKRINDEFGHGAGDEVLAALGELLRTRLRRADEAFRVGGEEFLVLLPNTAEPEARVLAERLLATLRRAPLLANRAVTASAGVAAIEPDDTVRAWLARADRALYTAKRAGRDRVVSAARSPATPQGSDSPRATRARRRSLGALPD